VFEVYSVRDDAPETQEQLGTKHKFWFTENGRMLLFKEGRERTGENWAEKVASEICNLLHLPHAEYQLAVWRNRQGVVTQDFVPEDSRLVFGNELLARYVPEYDGTRYYRQREHALKRVLAFFDTEELLVPLTFDALKTGLTAADVFVGYLLLDAWIGNTDRHHENWGVITIYQQNETPAVRLAPTFDHAASLGRELTDEKREARMTTKDPNFSVSAYADRARSALYKNPGDRKPMTSLEAFQEAMRFRPDAGRFWMDRLKRVDQAQVADIFAQIPHDFITRTASEFAIAFLDTTKQSIMETEATQ
jgi:hypothetical protein